MTKIKSSQENNLTNVGSFKQLAQSPSSHYETLSLPLQSRVEFSQCILNQKMKPVCFISHASSHILAFSNTVFFILCEIYIYVLNILCFQQRCINSLKQCSETVTKLTRSLFKEWPFVLYDTSQVFSPCGSTLIFPPHILYRLPVHTVGEPGEMSAYG